MREIQFQTADQPPVTLWAGALPDEVVGGLSDMVSPNGKQGQWDRVKQEGVTYEEEIADPDVITVAPDITAINLNMFIGAALTGRSSILERQAATLDGQLAELRAQVDEMIRLRDAAVSRHEENDKALFLFDNQG